MKLKICGLKYLDNIKEVVEYSPDYLGFIFYEHSKRYVGQELDRARLNNIDSGIKKVGVFVNATEKEILQKIDEYNLDFVQLHGDETPEFCKQLSRNVKIIKAFGVDEEFDFLRLNEYKSSIEYFLFDTKTLEHGGSGKQFDWNILEKYDNEIPFFLSGGIDINDIGSILQLNKLNIHAIDVNSKFEIRPGLKDINKIKKLRDAIHS